MVDDLFRKNEAQLKSLYNKFTMERLLNKNHLFEMVNHAKLNIDENEFNTCYV